MIPYRSSAEKITMILKGMEKDEAPWRRNERALTKKEKEGEARSEKQLGPRPANRHQVD